MHHGQSAMPPPKSPSGSLRGIQDSAMAASMRGNPPHYLKRSFSTPTVGGATPSSFLESQSLAPQMGEKKRNKLGYHRTSIACGESCLFLPITPPSPSRLPERGSGPVLPAPGQLLTCGQAIAVDARYAASYLPRTKIDVSTAYDSRRSVASIRWTSNSRTIRNSRLKRLGAPAL
jgi:hypothetical protein